jgi:hypothetical protein
MPIGPAQGNPLSQTAILEALLRRMQLGTPQFGSIEAARLPIPLQTLKTAEQSARSLAPGPGEAAAANIGGGTALPVIGSPTARLAAPSLATSTVSPPVGGQGPGFAPAPSGTGAAPSSILAGMLGAGRGGAEGPGFGGGAPEAKGEIAKGPKELAKESIEARQTEPDEGDQTPGS